MRIPCVHPPPGEMVMVASALCLAVLLLGGFMASSAISAAEASPTHGDQLHLGGAARWGL